MDLSLPKEHAICLLLNAHLPAYIRAPPPCRHISGYALCRHILSDQHSHSPFFILDTISRVPILPCRFNRRSINPLYFHNTRTPIKANFSHLTFTSPVTIYISRTCAGALTERNQDPSQPLDFKLGSFTRRAEPFLTLWTLI